ncbi:hypothetical protein BJI67_12250 [Acidihalobacter aeolianus]|uniref:Transcription regulator PadR N-terminal domain-containing protein n=1 Tax=Acidihalobacter aeolianus TaxID=2792603 RepID=A0A1D8K9S5_9GAMM|nr:helix-turn-helix transcriptional regulator [Acidihalobacter aeolianus]AOV17723.1 hypothetical protein BJI67_12250 [Acidihalobacter aeolianus]
MSHGDRGKQGRHLASFALLLLAEHPSHGLALHKDINALLPEGLQVDAGNLYRLLREMETRGAVVSDWHTESAGPARRIYRITEQGYSELAEWRDDIAKRRKAFDLFLNRYESLRRSL